MQGILLILALAVTVEAVVEYVKSIVKMFTEKDYRTAITQLSAAAIAIALCVIPIVEAVKFFQRRAARR